MLIYQRLTQNFAILTLTHTYRHEISKKIMPISVLSRMITEMFLPETGLKINIVESLSRVLLNSCIFLMQTYIYI